MPRGSSSDSARPNQGSPSGLRLTAHQFRHVAAKIWLDENPGAYEVVRRVLRHRSIDTTTENYTGFETQAAGLQYDRLILEQRRRFLEIKGGRNGRVRL